MFGSIENFKLATFKKSPVSYPESLRAMLRYHVLPQPHEKFYFGFGEGIAKCIESVQ